MIRLYADTFLFFAFLNVDDGAHGEAVATYDALDGELVTTEWVITELADGLSGIPPPNVRGVSSRDAERSECENHSE
jgi:hypothetical protein